MVYRVYIEEFYVNDKHIPFEQFFNSMWPMSEFNREIYFYQKDLDSEGIDEIKKIEIQFSIYNPDDGTCSLNLK